MKIEGVCHPVISECPFNKVTDTFEHDVMGYENNAGMPTCIVMFCLDINNESTFAAIPVAEVHIPAAHTRLLSKCAAWFTGSVHPFKIAELDWPCSS